MKIRNTSYWFWDSLSESFTDVLKTSPAPIGSPFRSHQNRLKPEYVARLKEPFFFKEMENHIAVSK